MQKCEYFQRFSELCRLVTDFSLEIVFLPAIPFRERLQILFPQLQVGFHTDNTFTTHTIYSIHYNNVYLSMVSSLLPYTF